MPEDEYDFAEANPSMFLPLDEHALPFDYKKQLLQKGYTNDSPPDSGGLFKALATEYIPSIVVNLPPRVVERVSWRDRTAHFFSMLFGLLLFFLLYGTYVALGISLPYTALADFELKNSMQAVSFCTITSEQSYTVSYDSDDGQQYSPWIEFTLYALDNRNYNTIDGAHPWFSSLHDMDVYLSGYQVNYTYPCWYNPANPTQATLARGEINFGDYVVLFFNACVFLLFGVLPNVLLIRFFVRALADKNSHNSSKPPSSGGL